MIWHVPNPIQSQTKGRRSLRGTTLIELLVVLGIVTLLAALILPSVKSVLSDRKTSQAAIMVKNFLEAGRARAIGKNRSVAVVLERLSGRALDVNNDGVIDALDVDPSTAQFLSATATSFLPNARASQSPDANFLAYNACIKLSLAEEPMAITEKSVPPGFTIRARHPLDGLQPTIPSPYDPLFPLMDSDQSRGITEVRIFQVTFAAGNNAALLLGDYLVAGNEISLGETTTRYTIVSPTTSAPHYASPPGNGTSTIWFAVINERGVDGLGEIASNPYINLQADEVWTRFSIFQKPKPIYAQTIQLPKGTCVDLSLSGFANDRVGFSDYRVRFSSDWVISGSAGIPTPHELRPIYIVFSPDGGISKVYANHQAVSGTVSPQPARIDVVDDIFLHVGRIEQVYCPTLGRSRATVEADALAGAKQNLIDPSTYVLRLSPKSGGITAAPITQFTPDPTDTLGDIIGKSRTGTFSTSLSAQ